MAPVSRTFAGFTGANSMAGSHMAMFSTQPFEVVRARALEPRRTASSVVIAASHGGEKEVESPLAKFLIGGGVTVFFEAFAGGHFLEFLKIAKQTSTDSYLTIARKITAEKGLMGTLDGFMPWGVLQCLVKGAVFSFGQAQAMSMLHDNTVLGPQATMVLTGGIGGFVQGVVMSPLLLLKTRVMTDSAFRKSASAWQSTVASSAIGLRVIRAEGMGGLFTGMGLFASKRFLDWTTRFAFVELVQDMVKGRDSKKKLSNSTKLMCSLAGGCLSALATIPVDVTVAVMQDANTAGKKTSFVSIYKEQLAKGLPATLEMATRGLMARVAHVAMTTMLMKTVTTNVYDFIYRR